jgi:triphosphatase
MTACRDHWGRNLQAACAGQREALHQARVGIRRFRTALALFRDYIPPSQYDPLRAEAKVLNEALGPARDLDVFIGDLGQSRSRKPVTDSDTTAISRAAEEAHATAYRNVASTLRGARYRRFMVRLNTWLIGRRWRVGKQRAKDGSRQAKGFACKILNKRIAQIQKQTKSLEFAPPKVLHAMRVAIKKARYGLEFFITLLPTRRAARTGRYLKALQDTLGALNDRDVAYRTVATLIASADDKKQRWAIKNEAGKLTTRLKSSAKASLARAAKAAAHLRFQERF